MKRTIIGAAILLSLVVIVSGGLALSTSQEAVAAGQGGQPCGGFAGLECPSPKQICVDDPRDNCDPKKGGADCIGICRGPGGGA